MADQPLDQRAVRRQPHDGRVVPAAGVHQDGGIGPRRDGRDEAQDLRQLSGAEFAGSTRAVRERGQPDAVARVHGFIRHDGPPVE